MDGAPVNEQGGASFAYSGANYYGISDRDASVMDYSDHDLFVLKRYRSWLDRARDLQGTGS